MNNFYYFFRSNAEYTEFTNMGPVHVKLLMLAILGVIIILKRSQKNRFLELAIGGILFLQQVTLYTWYIFSGYNTLIEGLPLYHCRIAIILLSVGLLFKQESLRKLGSYWGIFGSIAALLFPGLDPFLFPHITQFSYFIGHILLLWGSVYCFSKEKIGMTKKEYKSSLLFTNIYHVIMFMLNNLLDSNYGYMRTPPINIGQNLNPIIYGLVVIAVFNTILRIEYTLINKKTIKNESFESEYSVAN